MVVNIWDPFQVVLTVFGEVLKEKQQEFFLGPLGQKSLRPFGRASGGAVLAIDTHILLLTHTFLGLPDSFGALEWVLDT